MGDNWFMIAGAVATVFLVIAVGAGIRAVGWFTKEADDSLFKLVVRVLFPALIFDVVSQSTAFENPSNLIFPPLLGYGTMAGGMLVGLAFSRLTSRLTGLVTREARNAFAASVGIFNYGYIPIPLIGMIFDDQQTMGVLFLFMFGAELAIWTVGVTILHGRLGQDWWRRMINPPSVTIPVALAFNFLDLAQFTPGFFTGAVSQISKATIPVSMLLVGTTIADELRRHLARGIDGVQTAKIGGGACLLRVALLPVGFLALGMALPISIELKRVLVVEAAMPAAVFPIVLSRIYGGEPSVAVRVVFATSAVSLLTIPMWLWVGELLLLR